jgi:catechol 2,3-dioxygenase-like lactoylglutathione lyase family enzyme
MTITGIDTVAVVVSDRKKAIRWYRDVLGLRVAYIGPFESNTDPSIQGSPDKLGHWIELGPGRPLTRIHLCQLSDSRKEQMRRYEKRGHVFFRGYRTAEHETPFAAGFIVTYLDASKSRSQAIAEALDRTDSLLEGGSHINPLAERIRVIRDEILKAKELKEIVSLSFLKQKLRCNEDQIRLALDRAKQLYKDEIIELKIFNFPYCYHSSLGEEDLKIAIEDKKDYIRRVKGKDNRIGHNWEACVEFFVDKLTKGAEFLEQAHRSRMDKRRITLKLLKPIGERKLFAEVDRVWTICPSPISQPITYVLECKWGLVRRRDLEGFLSVLKWSYDFGVDTPEGRAIKQGIIGIFAGTAFNPEEKVTIGNESVSLAQYAARMNIQLLKATDLNEMLHGRGVEKRVTVQKICTRARNEGEVRDALAEVWNNPTTSKELLDELANKNAAMFEFEKTLEHMGNIVPQIVMIQSKSD